VIRWVLLVSMTILSISCASGPCRELRQPELAAQQDRKVKALESGEQIPPAVSPSETAKPVMKTTDPVKNQNVGSKDSTVLIYKADGSLQCGGARGISIDEMERSLNGIKVFSREKRPDGLMHIQVCGSPTGMVNVYEIPASNLPSAEKLGFQRFEAR
jgi:hypothetical protein